MSIVPVKWHESAMHVIIPVTPQIIDIRLRRSWTFPAPRLQVGVLARDRELDDLGKPRTYTSNRMAYPSQWHQAWTEAQPKIASLAGSVQTMAQGCTLRVGQLDAELLDEELVQTLQEPLMKAFSLVDVSTQQCLRHSPKEAYDRALFEPNWNLS